MNTKIVLALSAIFMMSPTEGEWVTSKGDVLMKPCESVFINRRMRMPRGCVAEVAGVLLERDYFVALETDKVERDRLLKGKDEQIRVLKDRVRALEGQQRLLITESSHTADMPTYLAIPLGVGLGIMGCSVISKRGLFQ